MKTKLFLAFIAVILLVLVSNLIFAKVIMRDFDSYVRSVNEDQYKWIVASIDETYSNGQWDRKALAETIHWAMMLGFHLKILDDNGEEVIESHEVAGTLSDSMRRRMEGLYHMGPETEESAYRKDPLVVGGKSIGTLFWHQFSKERLKEKEAEFKKRTRTFLYSTIAIAGGGGLLLAFFFSLFLSRPLTTLKRAAEKIADGDFTARTALKSTDEIGDLSRSFDKMAASLQKEDELRKRLMANTAHELRTPLTIMKTQIEAISDGMVSKEEGFENIKNAVERFIRLINGCDDFMAAEASFVSKGKQTKVNLKEFLSGLVSAMLPSFAGKGLSLTVASDSDLSVMTDDERLETIVQNLLSNALKFTESGGVTVDYGKKDQTFFIQVRDTGRGIPEADLPFIFDRFFRGSKPKTEGLGLGLAIVKELVDAMGGKIEVRSEAGKGSTFTVYLKDKERRALVANLHNKFTFCV